ncbi:hypothetical protein HDU97_002423 [Phlyctochytrium planicorne]|nr:hypothetical protein HDU97_002423 [Phlyctochytrium planicorne]
MSRVQTSVIAGTVPFLLPLLERNDTTMHSSSIIPPISFAFNSIIHLLPLIGAIGPNQLKTLYGIPIKDKNLIVLMRHRATMFGILGSYFCMAVVKKSLRPAGYAMAAASMVGYMGLLGGQWKHVNEKLKRVFWVDAVGFVLLGIGWAFDY